MPRPNVDSAIVTIRRAGGTDIRHQRAADLAQAAFGQRRKMVRSSLRSVLPDPESVLAEAGIPRTVRAEELTPMDYLKLAEVAP